jgi:hypothetical protein
MAEPIPPEVLAAMETQALHNPHQLFIVDRALKLDVNAFISSVTLGNMTPQGLPIAVATLTLSTSKLREICESIISKIDNSKSEMDAEYKAFISKLP